MNTMRTPEKDYWRQTYDTRLFLQIRTVFRMKKTLKYTALLVCFLAGLQLLVGGLVRSGFIGAGDGATGWIETFFRLVLNPALKTTLLVLALSLSVLGILFFLERTKRKAPSSTPLPRTPSPSIRKEPVTRPWGPPDRPAIIKDRVDVAEEWNSLEEADKEAIRAIVSQEGLWETDIIALLQARGFLHPTATLEALAERVSFVHCDYAGYHSVPPEYQAELVGVLANSQGEDSF
jgi:hypothetical protein